jgi:hypothetical protein
MVLNFEHDNVLLFPLEFHASQNPTSCHKEALFNLICLLNCIEFVTVHEQFEMCGYNTQV